MNTQNKFPQKLVETPLGTMSQGEFLDKVDWESQKKEFFRKKWKEKS